MFRHPPGTRDNSTGPHPHDPGDNLSFWGLWGPESEWQCAPFFDKKLAKTSELGKWSFAIASTLMALLPPLMAFSPVVTANIGFLCHLSTTQGFIAAAFTFGLPVRQLDTWKTGSIRVKELLANPRLCHENSPRPFTEMAGTLLALIKDRTLRPGRPRRVLVLAVRFIFAYVQAFLIWVLLSCVPKIDTFNLVWLCPKWGTVAFDLFLRVTFTFVGWWRAKYERESCGGDEVIYINTTLSTSSYWRRLQDPCPMVVILRPSNIALERDPCQPNLLVHYFVGMLQALWICFLSVFFGSTIGGTVFRTLIMVITFAIVIGVSRGLSILACWVAQKYLQLIFLEYDSPEERMAVQILLGGLTGALLDIQWKNYQKTGGWQRSVKLYQWGHRLSHGGVMEVPDAVRCTLHTKPQLHGDFIDSSLRIVGAIFFDLITIITPSLAGWDNDTDVSIVRLVAATIITIASTVSLWYLGLTKKLVICNCG